MKNFPLTSFLFFLLCFLLTSCIQWTLDRNPNEQEETTSALLEPDLSLSTSAAYHPNGTYTGTAPRYYNLTLKNLGDLTATGVVAEFTAQNSELASPTSFSIEFGDIAGGGQASPALVDCEEGFGSFTSDCGRFSLRLNVSVSTGLNRSIGYTVNIRDNDGNTWEQTISF